jgi:hypothetical protein
MIEEMYVLYPTAILAKKKGFKGIWCKQSYGNDGKFYMDNLPANNKDNVDICIAAPTQSFLATWLRDTHRIFIGFEVFYSNDYYCDNYGNLYAQSYYRYKVSSAKINYRQIVSAGEYFRYEEAFEDALWVALNAIGKEDKI